MGFTKLLQIIHPVCLAPCIRTRLVREHSWLSNVRAMLGSIPRESCTPMQVVWNAVWVIFARGIKAEVRAQRERMEIRQCLLAQVLVNLVLPIPHPLRRALRKRIVHVTKGTKGQPVQISRAANHVLLVFTKQLLQMDLSVPRV